MRHTKSISICGLLLILCTAFSAHADTNTFYGDFRYSFNSVDAAENTTSGNNNASRVGYKGDLGLNESLQAFYHLQVGVNVDGAGDAFSQRFFFAGLKGKFGTVSYGRTSTAYKMPGVKMDPFYDTSAGLGFGGANFGLSPLTNGWTDNSFAYASPSINNISINASTYLDDSSASKHDMNVGVVFKKEAHSFGVQYLSVGDTGVVAKSVAKSDALRVHAGTKFGKWSAAVSAESIDVPLADKQSYHYVTTSYQHRENLKFSASFGRVDGVSALADGNGFSAGTFYEFPSKTTISLVYSNVDLDAGIDRQAISIGVSQKFKYSID